MAALHLRAIEGLALAVEARDNLNTRGHLRRVQVYALGLGRALGLSAAELEALHAASLLHDIGKLAVPEHILTKPGKLTPEEFAKMKVHPLVGAEIVEQVQFPYPVAPIVRAHHEKFDGSGYPFGLEGEEIPLGGRILTVVDCLDALTSDREYRRAQPLDDAIAWIASESGRSFDPRVVEALLGQYRELDLMARASVDQAPMLSTDVMISNGHTPDAGLDLCAIAGLGPGVKSTDFLTTIAAARREGKMLLEMAQGVGSSLNLEETLERIESSLRPVIPFDALAILVRKGNALAPLHAAGENKEMLSRLHVPVGEGLTGWVAQNGRPVVNGNPVVDPGFRIESGPALNCSLALPLEGPSGFAGVMALYRRDRDAFSRDDLRILAEVTPRIGVALDNALRFRELETMANIDGLTDLPNARLLMQSLENELARAKREKQTLCVTVCQLSGLAAFRDRFGRPVADQFIRQVAKAMKECSRKYDYLARVADDRFALIMPGMTAQDLLGKTAKLDAVAEEASRMVVGDGLVCFMFGNAFYPDDADSARALLAIAEHHMEQRSVKGAQGILALEAQTRNGQEAPSIDAAPASPIKRF